MSTRAELYRAEVLDRERVSEHLVRLVLGGDGLAGWRSTGVPDEWVSLVVPGQFQGRFYTVAQHRDAGSSASGGVELVLDVVVHEEGLVTGWASRDCPGETVTLSAPSASFARPADAAWLLLVGDLTALPAMARIVRETSGVPVGVWAESADDLPGYLPEAREDVEVSWSRPPGEETSALAAVVESIDWPGGEGYFWMAGESSQMRAIRTHLMRVRRLSSSSYDVMGYWRAGARRQPRAVDPGPIYRAGRTAGKTDEQIWADYDAAREAEESS